MNNLGLHVSDSTVYTKSSAISNADVTKALGAVATKLEYVGNAIGDLNGYGPSSDKSFKPSLSGAIGNFQNIGIDLPLGAEFSDYVESFTTDDKNDFILSLVPIGDLNITGASGVTYVKVEKGYLRNSNEYTLSGRKLAFHTKPESKFSVIYKGRYPSIDGVQDSGYTPNVYPSPELISKGLQDRPTIEFKGNGYYELSIPQQNRNSYGDLFSSKLDYALSEKLQEFISPTGGTVCPSEHIALWKLFGDKFQRIEDASISILAPNKIRFQTGIVINPSSDLIIVSVNNWTVSDTLNAVTRYILKHRHSSSEVGSQILHKDLIGLRAERYNKDSQQYGESIISGDDHPQYFNREGYIQNNPGNFNNAIIGDVLIGSTNNFNLYNNTIDDSRKIYFGSISAASIMYDSAFKGLLVYSANNGIKIETKSELSDPQTRFGIGLEIDGHKVFAHGAMKSDANGIISETPNVLKIEAEDGLIEMNSSEGGGASLTLKNINTETGSVSGVIDFNQEGSGIKVGKVLFANEGDNITIQAEDDAKLTFNAKTDFDTVDIKTLTPELITIKDDGKIRFGDQDADYIRSIDGTIDFVNKKPVSHSTSGKNTGISIKTEGYTPFVNMYSSAEGGGGSTPTDHDTYIESGAGDVYFLKDSTTPQSENGTTYVFGQDVSGTGQKRVDNLKAWPRSSVYGGLGDYYSINVLPSSLQDRRGLNFDDSASIYATGNDTECPPGWLVLESKNGAVFIDARAGATDCQTIVYSDVSTGPLKVFGDASVDRNIGVSGDANISGEITSSELVVESKATIGNIEVKEDSKFTGAVQFTENVSINSELDVGGAITTSNRITANEVEVKSRSFLLGPVDIGNSVNIDGVLSANANANVGGDLRVTGKSTTADFLAESATIYKLRTTDEISAQGGITTSGKLIATGNIQTEGDVIAAGGKFSNQIRTTNITVEQDAVVNNELYVEGKFQAAGDITLGSTNGKMSVYENSTFIISRTTMLGTFEVSQESKFRGDVDVVGSMTISSTSDFKGGMTIGGPVTSTSSAEYQSLKVSDQVRLDGDVQIGSRLSVEESVSIRGGISVRGDSSIGDDSSIIVISGRSQFNRESNFTNNVTVSGDLAISGKTTITGEFSVNSKVEIEGELIAGGNSTVKGILTTSGIKANGQAEFASGLTSGKVVTTEALVVNDSSVLSGGLTVSGDATFSGSITTSPKDTATFGIVNISGSVNQSDNNLNNQFAGNTFFNNNVSVASDLTVKGRLKTGSDTSGCLIESNSITLLGSTSSINSTNANLDKITGSSKITISSISGTSISTKLSSIANKSFTSITNACIEDTQVNKGDVVCLGTLYVGAIQTIETPGSQNLFTENSSTLNMRVARARYAP